MFRMATPMSEIVATSSVPVYPVGRTRLRVALDSLRNCVQCATTDGIRSSRWARGRARRGRHRRVRRVCITAWAWAAHPDVSRTRAEAVRWAPALAVKTRDSLRVGAHRTDEVLAHRRRGGSALALQTSFSTPRAIATTGLRSLSSGTPVRTCTGSWRRSALWESTAPAPCEILNTRENLVSA